MYCLSQFCCLCLRNKLKLKRLHEATCGGTTFIQTANVTIPEIQLSEISHVASVCEDCVSFVAEMRTFRRRCADNNFLLVEYIELLSSFGGEIANAQVEMSDLTIVKGNVREEEIIACDVKLEWIKTEKDESENSDLVAAATEVYCDETAISEAWEEECKIEINDDFNDKYGGGEINDDDQLEGLFEDSTSREGDNFMKFCKKNTFYKCKICERSLKSKLNFKKHVSIHDANRRKYQCEACDKTFFKLTHLKIHSSVHTGEKLHECDKCGRSYHHLAYLKSHMTVHNKKARCGKCGKRFRCKTALAAHDKTHDREKPRRVHNFNIAGLKPPYVCETCGKVFPELGPFKTHLRYHAREKSHKCETCGKCFAFAKSLKNHALAHSGEKPHKCKTCGKRFGFSIALKKHVMVHTGERPHKCDVCGDRFRDRNDLNRHTLVHTGEKPHNCDVCGKSFRLASNLKKHAPVHSA